MWRMVKKTFVGVEACNGVEKVWLYSAPSITSSTAHGEYMD